MTARAAGLALIVLAATAAGCSKSGSAGSAGSATMPHADARAFIAGIRLCETTETSLRERLGVPTRDGRLAQRRVVSWIVDDGDVTAYLAVLLDERGQVVDLYWDIPTEVPWTPTDHCAPAAA